MTVPPRWMGVFSGPPGPGGLPRGSSSGHSSLFGTAINDSRGAQAKVNEQLGHDYTWTPRAKLQSRNAEGMKTQTVSMAILFILGGRLRL